VNRDEYRALVVQKGGKPPRSKEELQLQIKMAAWLRRNLRDDVRFTASAAGVYLGHTAAHDLAASGLEPGWPDLQFFCPDGVTRYVEVKVKGGVLSADQKDFRDLAQPHGVWSICRTLDELKAQVRAWGLVKLEAVA
jgi:hypothetical protein